VLFTIPQLKTLQANEPAGTAFTYQGQLKQGGVPVTDTCDFQFTLWNAEAGGRQAGSSGCGGASTIVRPDVSVTNGLFTVPLNFGCPEDTSGGEPGAFNGDARWLEVSVDCDGSGPTKLSPRQPIAPTPYALHTWGTAPVFNVQDFGAVGDGANDDAPAFNEALAAIGLRGGTVVVPPTLASYRLESTVEFGRNGTRLVGLANPGLSSGPTLSWGGMLGGTMVKVPKGMHEPYIQAIRFDASNPDGANHAGICLHVEAVQGSSTKRPRMEDLEFRGYLNRGLVLGVNDEASLQNGQLENVTGINLRFRGGGPAAIGLFVNAQNAEWINLIGMNFDPATSPPYNFNNHGHHIFTVSGAVNISGMVSTRADPNQFAIVSKGEILINGWRSEDCKLIELSAVDPGGPITLQNILQRGCPTSGGNSVIDIRTGGERPVSIGSASLRGRITIPNEADARVSLDNVSFLFDGDGVFRTGGLPISWNMAFQDVANGTYRLCAPLPIIQLEDADQNVVYKNIAGRISGVKSISMNPTDSPGVCDRKGAVYFDDSLSEMCFCNGSDWLQMDGGGSCEQR